MKSSHYILQHGLLINLLAYIRNPITFSTCFFFVSKFDFRFSHCMPKRFTESEIRIAIRNILKLAPDRKNGGGRQKTNNSEKQGDDEQVDVNFHRFICV